MFKSLLLIMLCFPATIHAVEADIGSDAARAAGKVIYEKRCSQCHGDTGNGKGIAYTYLKPWPRDFTRGQYKFKSTPDDRLPTTEDIMRVIRHGNPYTGMPAWPQLTDTEVRQLAYYVKSFSADFADPEILADESIAPIPLKIPSSAPKWSAELAARGKELFKENKCIDCHGMAGRGSGTSAPTTEDMDGNQIRPRDLTKRWTFRNGSSRLDIFRTLSMGNAPMPSFHNLPEEDRWALVDYVTSLGSRDEAEYSQVVIAVGTSEPLDLDKGEALFADAPTAYFPVMGQITQPGRAFYASADGIEVKSVYNEDDIAFHLAWHDMSPEVNLDGLDESEDDNSGWVEKPEQLNSPDMELAIFDPSAEQESHAQFSDAIAIQIPSKPMEGVKKPYFIFGDASNAVDLWFGDMANDLYKAKVFTAKTAADMERIEDQVGFTARYRDGRWTAIFKRKRMKRDSTSFVEDTFVPIAFSIWDGFNNERGNKRGLTEWFHVYLKPTKEESIVWKMFCAAMICLVIELLVVFFVRRTKVKVSSSGSEAAEGS